MKISKVGHVRTAVGIRENKKADGFLYKDPNRDRKELSVGRRFERLSRTAERLYSVVGPLQSAEQKDKGKKQIYQLFRKINEIYRRSSYSADILSRTHISESDAEKLSASHTDPAEFLLLKLKKTLRSSDLQENWVKLFRFVFLQDEKLDIGAAELQQFSQILVNDYKHEKTRANVEKAISHQNMLVQPDPNGILRLPDKWEDASTGSKKDRDALNEFLLHYADLNENVRKQYRLKLRRLIQLYFYGPDAVIDTDFDEWADHAARRTDNPLFLSNFTTQHKRADGTLVESTGESDYYALKDQWDNLQTLKAKDKSLRKQKITFSKKHYLRSTEERELKNKIKDTERKVKFLISKIQEDSRYETIRAYRESLQYTKKHLELFFQKPEWNTCFIHLIENQCNLLLSDFTPKKFFRLTKGYLSEKCWKYLINYFSIKYIAIGKAVYYYACDNFGKTGDITLGQFKNGLSAIHSFDYEMIQASQELQRDTTVYIAFAIQNFAQNAFLDEYRADENHEDVMLYDLKDIQAAKRPDALRRVLQFFGGKSRWNDILSSDYDETAFLMDLKNMLYLIRNKTFHFNTGNTDNSKWNEDRILDMIQKDIKECSTVRRKTWYSNNLWMFYSEKSLGRLMSLLYQDEPVRGAQVPSFRNVLGRKALKEFLRDAKILSLDNQADDIREMWQNGYYFVLKEIYYQKFLAEPSLKQDFYNYLNLRLQELEGRADSSKQGDKSENPAALKEFLSQWKQLCPSLSFSEICQYYMTEYNAQNQDIHVVQSSKMQENNKKIYQHYKMILYHGIKVLFMNYILKQDAYAFLQNPKYKDEKLAVENFLPTWSSDTFHKILDHARKNRELQCWYVCSKFMAPRQVNHLGGVFRHYQNYVSEIKRRANENHQNISIHPDLSNASCEKLISLMDFSGVLSGKISDNFEDYFSTIDGKNSIEAYSAYLSKYANLNEKSAEPKPEPEYQTHAIGDGSAIMYNDSAHPILNRNVVMAMLYAPENVLENAISRIGYNEYKEYNKLKQNLPGTFANGGLTKLSEQKSVNAFRDSKNRVELLNLYEYAEIISELQSQLVSWSYLRERDLLYFQLGFHYLCLQNDSYKPDGYDIIKNADGRTIHGGILYQTLAVFVHGYPIYCVNNSLSDKDKQKFATSAMQSIGPKAALFEKNYKGAFDAGKELFQVASEESNITNLRNYIDHFKYYAKADRSMIDLYSEVFDRFFTYDQRLRKNVPNVFSDILARHFIKINGLHFVSGTKTVGKDKQKEMAQFAFDKLTSDTFTYELINDEKDDKAFEQRHTKSHSDDRPQKIELPAKGERFLKDVQKILYYKAV